MWKNDFLHNLYSEYVSPERAGEQRKLARINQEVEPEDCSSTFCLFTEAFYSCVFALELLFELHDSMRIVRNATLAWCYLCSRKTENFLVFRHSVASFLSRRVINTSSTSFPIFSAFNELFYYIYIAIKKLFSLFSGFSFLFRHSVSAELAKSNENKICFETKQALKLCRDVFD